jgi:tetratricopeptide (TPR) repeat protein
VLPPLPAIDEAARARDPRRRELLEAYENLAHQSHFETLGVTPTATDHEIKQAFFQKAKKFHPDQYRDPLFADIADRIEALFMRIGGAYEVLRDPESRQSYEAVLRRRRSTEPPRPAVPPPAGAPAEPEKSQDALIDTAENAWMAEEAIHRAERLIAHTKEWDAIQLLQAVIPRIFGRKQRERARVLLAKAYLKNPNWLRRGEELLQTVIQEDPQNAEAHYALGMLYKESGMSSRSVAMFKKAVELRPDHKHALAELNALSGPAFLRKLFGKG